MAIKKKEETTAVINGTEHRLNDIKETEDTPWNGWPIKWDVLREPFPAKSLKTRAGGGGKKLTYIDGATCIRRLIKGAGNNWEFFVDRYWIDEKNRCCALVTLIIDGAKRQHVGVQEQGQSGADAEVKGAITDGLKKAATLFGLAIELYGEDYDDSGVNVPVQAVPEIPSVTRPKTPEAPAKSQVDGYRRPEVPPEKVSLGELAATVLEAVAMEEIDKPTLGTDGAPLTDGTQLSQLHALLATKGIKGPDAKNWMVDASNRTIQNPDYHALSKVQVSKLMQEVGKL